jgi:hypothetical protein
MREEKNDFMEFKALGINCSDCGFSLTGRVHTIGRELCLKIEQEFRNGTLDIDIKNDQINFLFEGIIVSFHENPSRLSAIEQMLQPHRHLQHEACSKSNYEGFAIMAKD